MEDMAVSSAMLDELGVAHGPQALRGRFRIGYSSLSYLKRFPLDTLKINCSFVRDIATDRHDPAIVASIIGLAHNLQLEVIVEGVETEEQLAYLREKGCDIVQGFYFSEPLPAEAFWNLLKKGEPLLGVPVRDQKGLRYSSSLRPARSCSFVARHARSDEAVARDEPCQLLLVHALRAGRTHGEDHVAQVGGAVVDEDLHVVTDF
jgi:predicted signal transduction protein with EAL and GGDEF domain